MSEKCIQCKDILYDLHYHIILDDGIIRDYLKNEVPRRKYCVTCDRIYKYNKPAIIGTE